MKSLYVSNIKILLLALGFSNVQAVFFIFLCMLLYCQLQKHPTLILN